MAPRGCGGGVRGRTAPRRVRASGVGTFGRLTWGGGAGTAGRVEGTHPTGGTGCAALRPPECELVHEYDEAGKPTFTGMGQKCPTKECQAVNPRDVLYTWAGAGAGGMPANVNVSPWFCEAAAVGYNARVEKDTGLPPGKLEDDYARCVFERLEFAVGMGDCVTNRGLWSCEDCKVAYKDWLCATLFPRCKEGTTDSKNEIVKPCRDLCFRTIRRCPAHLRLECPDTDPRDYASQPDCNAVGVIDLDPDVIPTTV